MTGNAELPGHSIERLHCNECGQQTRHQRLVQRVQDGSERLEQHNVTLWWRTTYDLFECCGCEAVSLRRVYEFSEWLPEDAEVVFYPPRTSRRRPGWIEELPDETEQLFLEVYTALQADSRRLALMGARALIDLAILSRVGDVGTFEQKLEALETGGFISSRSRNVLASALDAGNAAAHRGHNPTARDLGNVLDIVEHLFETALLERAAEGLRTRTPPRHRREPPEVTEE